MGLKSSLTGFSPAKHRPHTKEFTSTIKRRWTHSGSIFPRTTFLWPTAGRTASSIWIWTTRKFRILIPRSNLLKIRFQKVVNRKYIPLTATFLLRREIRYRSVFGRLDSQHLDGTPKSRSGKGKVDQASARLIVAVN